jgi:hypothetical protein
MNGGWVMVHRRLLDHSIWSGERFTRGQAWVDLILRAAHDDHVVLQGNRTLPVARGQVLTSQVKLADRWRWDRETVGRFLRVLKLHGMVAIETSKATDTGYTLITLLNYNVFQGNAGHVADIGSSNGHVIESRIEPASTQHPTATIKKGKKGKKEKKERTEAPGLSWPDYLGTFDRQGQEILERAREAISSTRKTGTIAPSVLDELARQLCKYPHPIVVNSARIYIDGNHAAGQKDERYLLGIVRGEAKRMTATNGGAGSYVPGSEQKTEGQRLIEQAARQLLLEG